MSPKKPELDAHEEERIKMRTHDNIRVKERNIGKGLLTKATIQDHLDSLPDLADQVLVSEIPQPALGGHEG